MNWSTPSGSSIYSNTTNLNNNILYILCIKPKNNKIMSNNLPPTWPIGHVGGRLLLRYYDLYQRLQLQFYVLLITGAMDTRNM